MSLFDKKTFLDSDSIQSHYTENIAPLAVAGIGMGLSAIGGMYASNKAAGAMNNASASNAQIANADRAFAMDQWNTNKANYNPYLNAATGDQSKIAERDAIIAKQNALADSFLAKEKNEISNWGQQDNLKTREQVLAAFRGGNMGQGWNDRWGSAFDELRGYDQQIEALGELDPNNKGALGNLQDTANQGYQGYNPSLADYGNPNIAFNAPSAQSFGLNPNMQYGGSQQFGSGINPNLSRQAQTLSSPDATRFGGDANIQANVMSDPSVEFRRQQGQRGVENSASAEGMLLSGNTLKDLSRFNQGFASTEYGKAYDRSAQDFTRQQGQDRELFGAQRMVGLDQFGAQGTEADRAYAVASGNYDRGESQFGNQFTRQQGYADRSLDVASQNYARDYQGRADLYARQNAQAMDQYNTGSQNFLRNQGMMDSQFNRQYGMWGDQFNQQKTIADYGSAAAANQSAAGANASNTLMGIGQNQMSNNNQIGQIQAANAYAPINAMLGGANVGLSAYSMMNGGGYGGGTGVGSGGYGASGPNSGLYNNNAYSLFGY